MKFNLPKFMVAVEESKEGWLFYSIN